MIKEKVFHIYKKNTEETIVIKHCVTVDELEKMMADQKVDWDNWEICLLYTSDAADDP